MAYRTHNCNDLTFDNLNERVSLAGWVDTIRDHGGVAFIDLRDEYGVTQVVVNDGDLINHLRKESVISVDGTVVKRDEETINKKIATGELEVKVDKLTVLGACTENLPFEVSESKETREDVRLTYRFLDLRNKAVHDNIIFRSNVIAFLRQKMTEMGFKRNSYKRCRAYLFAAAEFCEGIIKHLFRNCKNILLRCKCHFKIKLIEFTR